MTIDTKTAIDEGRLFTKVSTLKARCDNRWLVDFLGMFNVQYETGDYGASHRAIIISEDGKKKFIGEAAWGAIWKTGFEEAMNDAIKEAFKAFSTTLPRMDRIVRYGR